MGRDKYTSLVSIRNILRSKIHTFRVIPDNFSLLEDGIIGLPFLQNHDYSITNHTVRIDNDQIPLYFSENPTVKSGEIIHTIGTIQNEAMRVCYVNTSKYDISNLEIEDDEIQVKELLDLLRLDHIENSYRDPIKKILIAYKKVFHTSAISLPCTNLTEHKIDLNKPINVKIYKPPEAHKTEIKRQIDKMLTKQIIEHSTSPYNSPVWVVPKKRDSSGKKSGGSSLIFASSTNIQTNTPCLILKTY